ncbi:helix-turn-helix transcriptional regulator [Paenibacillus sp. S150]|nr:helix-turn-helix transcriptional regulator [Paenibacillus sp. S150]
MIVNKLSELMGKKRLKISDVVVKSGLARNTVVELYHGRAKGVNFETLDKLCVALGCESLSEIVEFKQEVEVKS